MNGNQVQIALHKYFILRKLFSTFTQPREGWDNGEERSLIITNRILGGFSR